MSETAKPAATSAPPVVLQAGDLPAFCPNKAMAVWNTHPRVFLEVAKTGQAKCPYCGTQYQLEGGAQAGHAH
jgi:uncharacterized Zn-finger protein